MNPQCFIHIYCVYIYTICIIIYILCGLTLQYFFFPLPWKPTHNAEVFHIGCSFHLFGEPSAGELSVDHFFVTGAYKPTLLVQEDDSRTAEGERGLFCRGISEGWCICVFAMLCLCLPWNNHHTWMCLSVSFDLHANVCAWISVFVFLFTIKNTNR